MQNSSLNINLINNAQTIKPKLNKKNNTLSNNELNTQNPLDSKAFSSHLTLVQNYNRQLISFGNSCSQKSNRVDTILANFKKESKEPGQIFDLVMKSSLAPEPMMELLKKIMTDPELSQAFIKKALENPKEESHIITTLADKLGGEEKYLQWFTQEYYLAYQTYITKLFKEADSMDDLLKFAPNWNLKYLVQKQKMLDGDLKAKPGKGCEEETIPIKFGKVPQQFGSQEIYDKLLEKIGKSHDNGKYTISHKGIKKEFDVKIFGKDEAKSRSRKFIAKVNIEGKDFVVKSDAGNTSKSAMFRGDSPFIDACIDYYLTLNNATPCKCYFYDQNTNSSLYDFIPGSVMESDHQVGHPDYINIKYLNDSMKDINDLGVYCNENKRFNYIRTDENEVVPIDSGHFTYFQGLKPGTYMQMELPNEIGRSLPLIYAGLTKARLDEEHKEEVNNG